MKTLEDIRSRRAVSPSRFADRLGSGHAPVEEGADVLSELDQVIDVGRMGSWRPATAHLTVEVASNYSFKWHRLTDKEASGIGSGRYVPCEPLA